MRILSLTDLHMGGKGKANDFKNGKGFVAWVKSIIKKYGINWVYLIGDIFELWQFTMQEIRAVHYIVIRFITGRMFKRFIGNHDYQLMGSMTKTLITASGRRVLYSHCFQNDKWMTSPLSRLGIWILGKTLEKIWPNIDNGTGFKRNKREDKSRIMKKTTEYVMKKFAEGYDDVIGGHIHGKAFIKHIPGFLVDKRWGNCGTCSGGKKQGIINDTLTDEMFVAK